MSKQQKLAVGVSIVTVTLIIVAQVLSWRSSGTLNAGLLALLAVILPTLVLAFRKEPPKDQ